MEFQIVAAGVRRGSRERLLLPWHRAIKAIGFYRGCGISEIHGKERSGIGEERNPVEEVGCCLDHKSPARAASDVEVEISS